MKRKLLLAGLAYGLMLPWASSADSTKPPGEANADFRPAIVRLELDREQVSAGKSMQIRMDWRANVATRREYQLTLNLVGIGRPPDFSTNMVLRPPTSQWAVGELMRPEAFTITIPAHLSPGWRRMLFSLTDQEEPGRPIPLDNADRHERNSQYCFGEIEILPAGSDVPQEAVVRLPTNDPAKPDRGNEEWRMRHAERVADVKSHADKLEVLFIGDSITGAWLNIGKAIWEKEFVPLRAVNIGIAGSQTSHILWQFEHGAIDGINPRVAVLMIGVNHLLASPSHTTADIARGISAVVAKLRGKLPHTKILLLGTFPKDRAPNTPDRRKIQEINALIAKLDDGNWIRFLDISDRLLDKDGNLNADVSPDGVHLTENGYQKWAQAIRPFVVEMTAQESSQNAPPVLTPKPPPPPRINASSVFGVRPGSPFLYAISATGERPMEFGVENLPKGLSVNPATGRITGSLKTRGEHSVLLKARNAKGTAEKKLRIVVGDRIALTPPMGWNSWNCWADSVDQEKVMRSARALVSSGLINHGWSYVNIDDTWQGVRGGDHHAIQPNEKFSDMKRLCAEIHALGLKAGIYSTPWVTSYAKHIGGSSDRPDGAWTKDLASEKHWRLGKHSFAENDARQWAEWGFDYLKYDWNPNDIPHVREMSRALRKTGRDVVFSLSNSGPFADAAQLAELANCWRTTGDIWDYWDKTDNDWRYGVSELGFSQDRWAPYAGPGHWNDPDMLVVGWVGWGPQLHRTNLTPDEQYAHISLWCLLSAPLLIGCDLERLDDFTLGLLTNDEVLALDQDALGRQAVRIATYGAIDIYKKELEDGGWALGFFNRGDKQQEVLFNKLDRIGITGRLRVRDVWRQKDLPPSDGSLTVTVAAHGVVLLKLKAG